MSYFQFKVPDGLPVKDIVVMHPGIKVYSYSAALKRSTPYDGVNSQFAVSDKYYYCKSRTEVFTGRVFTCSVHSAGFVTHSGDAFGGMEDGSYLLGLGADSGCAQISRDSWARPQWDGSRVSVYSDPEFSAEVTNGIVSLTDDGECEFWSPSQSVWIVCRDYENLPYRFYPAISEGTPRGTALPTAAKLGDFFLLDGTGDTLYCYMADSSNANDWVEIMWFE